MVTSTQPSLIHQEIQENIGPISEFESTCGSGFELRMMGQMIVSGHILHLNTRNLTEKRANTVT